MLLTVSKRLEFSASRRVFVETLSESENLALFGSESAAKYGSGRNYVAYFVFTGKVDPETGMLINISEIKERAGAVIDSEFDHKFLNADNAFFEKIPPTAENVASRLYSRVEPAFAGTDARLVAVHLREAPDRSATVYADGAVEANYWIGFSAARETRSPNLSEEENEQRFGAATGLHGHNYRARLTFRSSQPKPLGPLVQSKDLHDCFDRVVGELDHHYLNRDVPGLKDGPITTESLATYMARRVRETIALDRIRLHEREDFFAEVWSDQTMFLGMRTNFSAAHRLHVRSFSEAENDELFGKCNNPRGHGHNYVVEATITGRYDARTGQLHDFIQFHDALGKSIAPWRDRHLDLETEEFSNIPSTGENIVRALWPKIDGRVEHELVRLRLWETANNRFTLRRGP